MAEQAKDMSFLDHLEELRWHLVRSAIAVMVVTIAAFVFKRFVFDVIIFAPTKPGFITNSLLCQLGAITDIEALCINSKPLYIISRKMAGQFTSHIMVSIVSGIVVAFPYILYELWKFIAPALHTGEKKYSGGIVLSASLLFYTGVAFAYFIIVPLSVNFLGNYQVSDQVQNEPDITSYISTVASIALAGGVVFELPIIIYFLTKSGLITPDYLKRVRKHALVVTLVLSAVITPPDIFSQILVSVPLLILYEIGIRISKRVYKKV